MYGVYQIYVSRRTIGNTYKYGITRVGPSRPQSQEGLCRNHYKEQGLGCRWDWELRYVRGWFHARKREAGLIARYKLMKGHCPPGQRVSCR